MGEGGGETRKPIPYENVNCVIKHKLFNRIIMGYQRDFYCMNLEAEYKCSKEESKDYPSLSMCLLPISRLLSRNKNQLGKLRRRLT